MKSPKRATISVMINAMINAMTNAMTSAMTIAVIIAAFGVAQVGALYTGASLSYAQDTSDEDDLSAPRGLYLGVKPGETNYAPGKRLESQGDLQRVVWIGFQARRDRAQVFIQTDSRPIFEIAESDPLKVVIDFPNARLHTRNEGRTLDASFFPTVVRSLRARQVSRKLVRLVIRLREPARYRKTTDTRFLHLMFDPPKEPIDVIAEHERDLERRVQNTEVIEYGRQ